MDTLGVLCPIAKPQRSKYARLAPRNFVRVAFLSALSGGLLGGCASQGVGRYRDSSSAVTRDARSELRIVDGAPAGAKTGGGLRCTHVSGTVEVEKERHRDGSIAWVLTFSSEARAALEAHLIIGDDGKEHPDLLALDCLVEAMLTAKQVCRDEWRHDENIATHISGGRLEVRGVCTNAANGK